MARKVICVWSHPPAFFLLFLKRGEEYVSWKSFWCTCPHFSPLTAPSLWPKSHPRILVPLLPWKYPSNSRVPHPHCKPKDGTKHNKEEKWYLKKLSKVLKRVSVAFVHTNLQRDKIKIKNTKHTHKTVYIWLKPHMGMWIVTQNSDA